MKSYFSTTPILGYLKSNAMDAAASPRITGVLPAITISRQAGARGTTIGKCLCERLLEQSDPNASPWTLLDRNLMTEVLQENQLPEAFAKYLPEDKINLIDAMVGEMVGLHPSLWTIQQQCAQTILRLCHIGHVIIVGRGGNIIAQGMPNVLHIRLVGSLDRRIEHMLHKNGMPQDQAHAYIKTEDNARTRYIQTTFGKDIEDATLYDAVINTDRCNDEALVKIIMDALQAKCGPPPVQSSQ